MDKEIIWQEVSYIISSEYRKKVLEKLESPQIPSKLSKELNINIAHVSRALSELEDKNLAKCLTPEANKGKLYYITEKGKKVLAKMKELK